MTENEIYHKIGKSTDPKDWIISFSDICKIAPETGGHPKIFYSHMCSPDPGDSSPSMSNGSLLHSWIENKGKFVIEELDKPGEKVALFCKTLFEFFFKDLYLTDTNFAHYSKGVYSVDLGILTEFNTMYRIFKGEEPTENTLKVFVYAFRYVREKIKYQPTYGETALMKNFKENRGIEYLKFLLVGNGKIIMTAAEKDIVTNCHESLKEHPLANRILFEIEGEHEKELFWEEEVSGIIIKRKAKVDKIIVDHNNKILTILDLKTTNYPVSNFNKVDGSYHRYNYGGQLASYADGYFKSIRMNPLDVGHWKIQLLNIVVQTNDNYPVIIYKTENESLKSAAVQRNVRRIAYHTKSNNWLTTYEEDKENYIIIQ